MNRSASPPAARRTRTCSRPPDIPCVNVANGTEHNHEPTERVTQYALEAMLDIGFTLLEEAATA